MSKFFIRRPIVAMVISIVMVIVGVVSMVSLPTAQFPDIVPPEMLVQATYPGADAKTLEQSVATPIEQQMNGVDNMNYMYSTSAGNGQMQLHVDFDVKTDPNIDQVLSQLRVSQAQSQLPAEVNTAGITVLKSPTAPLIFISVYSPHGTYDGQFLANYSYINLADQLNRVYGISRGAGVRLGQVCHAHMGEAGPAGQAGYHRSADHAGSASAEQRQSRRADWRRTHTPRTGVHLHGAHSGLPHYCRAVRRYYPARQSGWFGCASQGRCPRRTGRSNLSLAARYNGKPSAILALYQLPGSNAVEAAKAVRATMAQLSAQFPQDMSYAVGLDTTLAVTAGIHEIVKTLFEALALVVLVVYIFLQGWRATLIPLLAVPVSLIGDLRRVPAARLFHQHAVALWPCTRDRPGRR